MNHRSLFLVSLVLMAMAAITLPSSAQSSALTYQLPPQVLVDIIDAPPTPYVSLSPDRQWLLLMQQPGLPPIAEVAQPELRLAGLRINPRDNGPSRARSLNGLLLRKIGSDKARQITGIPQGGRITGITWAPDGQYVAFVITLENTLTLWVASIADAHATRISPPDIALNGVYGRPYSWLDNHQLIVRALPLERGTPPVENSTPTGPIVQENLGKVAPARTFQDLLQSPYDEELYTYYTTSQLVRINLQGHAKLMGSPAIFRRVSPSPDGQHLLVEMIHTPYSYSLKENDFPKLTEIWALDGQREYRVADLPLQDQVPISFGSVATGRRSVSWRNDKAAELVWVEALDGGDGGVEADERDQVYTLAAPFTAAPQPLITLAQRYGGITWGNDDLALVSSWWWKTRNVKVWRIHPSQRALAPQLIQDRSWQDRYSDPGDPMLHPGKFSRNVILTADNGRTIFLEGDGASSEGDRPFCDSYDLSTGQSTRLFRSTAPYYEKPVAMLDADNGLLLTRREAQAIPPNYFVRNLKNGDLDQQTSFPDPTPQLKGISKELLKYQRADGVQLTGTLYLPAGYDKDRDGPLPCLMWAYPTEFKSAADAGQVTDSPYRFTRVGWWSPELYLTQGYAVFDDPTMPIVGEGDTEPNDSFIEQLVASAQAAIDVVVAKGVVDRDRVAIGGHSYGAFMTANLLAHSDLFRAGLPRSGAYNRTLTPFGFQSEERTLWQAPEVYFNMSPFMHADKINEPILLVHGLADNNSGTFPLQSERMYGALKGLGATARLVMLPAESHGYRARESVLHLLWETVNWLDRYVKNAPPRQPIKTESGS